MVVAQHKDLGIAAINFQSAFTAAQEKLNIITYPSLDSKCTENCFVIFSKKNKICNDRLHLLVDGNCFLPSSETLFLGLIKNANLNFSLRKGHF